MHAGDPRQFCFEMRDGPGIRFVYIEIAEGTLQEGEQFRLILIALRTELNQLHEISRGLRPQVTASNARERIAQSHFRQGMQV